MHQAHSSSSTNQLSFRSVVSAMFVALLSSIMVIASTSTSLAQEIEPAAAELAAVSPQLSLELETTAEPVSFLVILKDQLPPDALQAADTLGAASADSITREARIATSYHALTSHAKQAQSSLRAWLDSQGIVYRPFYIVNMIEVTGDAALADALRRRPEVDRLVGNPQISQQHSSMASDGQSSIYAPWLSAMTLPAAAQSQDLPYGLYDTDADEVWKLGYTGEGITVASQDTGVQWDHPALQARYRGWSSAETPALHEYNWFDAWGIDGRPLRCANDAQIPCDDHGHGTHTVGTMLGNATTNAVQVGMAPDADWIGCRNMRVGVGTPASYTACFEFFLAPYPQNGDPFEDGRPELAPHIVNNSWGCPPSEGCDVNSLKQIVETVRAAGIFVVASAGNNGSSCSSVVDPIAIYDGTFSVGAHDASGAIASFSSRGPVNIDGSGRLKPDISAPGVSVYSTTVNDGYTWLQGTSMASPHVVGATALLWSAVPEFIGQIDMTEQVLIKSASPVAISQCGEIDARLVPNNVFGFGRLNALQAVQLAQHPAEMTVQVSQVAENSTAEIPLQGIGISLTDQLTGYVYETVTDAGGQAVFPQVLAGGYQLQASGDDVPLVSAELEFDQDVVQQENDVIQDGTRLRYRITGAQEEKLRLFWPIILNSR